MLGDQPPAGPYLFLSAEDVVLNKLAWFRDGGGLSDQQWHDIAGVLRVQGERMDREYLVDRAAEIGVSDLLAKALADPQASDA